MAEFYNAETLLEFVKQNTPNIDGETTMQCVERAIKNAPTADVEEVVRCGKCKHWRKMGYDPILEKDFGHCYNNDFPFMCETRPDTDEDDFCSYGERKTVTDTNVGGK